MLTVFKCFFRKFLKGVCIPSALIDSFWNSCWYVSCPGTDLFTASDSSAFRVELSLIPRRRTSCGAARLTTTSFSDHSCGLLALLRRLRATSDGLRPVALASTAASSASETTSFVSGRDGFSTSAFLFVSTSRWSGDAGFAVHAVHDH